MDLILFAGSVFFLSFFLASKLHLHVGELDFEEANQTMCSLGSL